jgi:hypothetical protein
MTDDKDLNHYTPTPAEPGLRVRLRKDGPWVDLGISHSELIIGLLDTAKRCSLASKVSLHPDLVYALDNLDVHRGVGKK